MEKMTMFMKQSTYDKIMDRTTLRDKRTIYGIPIKILEEEQFEDMVEAFNKAGELCGEDAIFVIDWERYAKMLSQTYPLQGNPNSEESEDTVEDKDL